MNFMELIKNRYSVRAFANRPIEDEKLQTILEAGRIAPTAKNNQPQQIYVVKSDAGLEKIDKATQCRYGAPVVLIVAFDKNKQWQNPLEEGITSGQQDASIVATHMMLAATELKIGSVWVDMFSPTTVKQLFNLPENIVPVLLMPLGYAHENAKPSPWHEQRKPLAETVSEL